jgi:hypothetical protein
MGRSKKHDQVIAERVRALRESNGTIVVNGRNLTPGTPEYERRLRKLAGYLDDEELAGLVGSSAKPRDP